MNNLYLIRRPVGIRDSSSEVWWRPGRNGYTGCIHEAGIYEQTETDEIISTVSSDHAEAVPVNQNILHQISESMEKARRAAEWRYSAAKADYENEINRILAAEMRFGEIRKKVTGNG